jgi:hypothetical protein
MAASTAARFCGTGAQEHNVEAAAVNIICRRIILAKQPLLLH